VDPRGNNLRVFVLMSAVRYVRMLGSSNEPIRARVEEFVTA
jgi:hypothetical protein